MKLDFFVKKYRRFKFRSQKKVWEVEWMAYANLTKATKSMHGWIPPHGNQKAKTKHVYES